MEGAREHSEVFAVRALSPFMRSLPSWPNHPLQKANHLLIPLHWGLGFNIWVLGNTRIPSVPGTMGIILELCPPWSLALPSLSSECDSYLSTFGLPVWLTTYLLTLSDSGRMISNINVCVQIERKMETQLSVELRLLGLEFLNLSTSDALDSITVSCGCCLVRWPVASLASTH